MAGVGGGGNNFAQLNQNIPGFGPNTGGVIRETKEERTQRLETEERNKEVLDDPYGLRRPEGNHNTGQTTRVVRKKVRVKRNNQQAENSGNTQGASRRSLNKGGQAGPNSLLNRTMNGQSSLVRASVLFKNNQSQNTQQANNQNVAVRNKMLNGLNGYIKNDYSMMKLNPDDKAFTYRTAEARQLGATIGQMVASTTRAAGGKDKKANNEESDSGSNKLSTAAYGRKKSLLRRLSAMSEPSPKLPDDLPTDYKPFESVA